MYRNFISKLFINVVTCDFMSTIEYNIIISILYIRRLRYIGPKSHLRYENNLYSEILSLSQLLSIGHLLLSSIAIAFLVDQEEIVMRGKVNTFNWFIDLSKLIH